MITDYTIMKTDGTTERRSIDWPEEPGFEKIAALVEPILGGDLEHVAVLHNEVRADMFVDDVGQLKGLPVNKRATDIYRLNWMRQHPGINADSLPSIVGTAILFDRIIWR